MPGSAALSDSAALVVAASRARAASTASVASAGAATSRQAACEACKQAKAGCVVLVKGQGCARCVHKGLRCLGPAQGVRPRELGRAAPGSVLQKFRSSAPGPTSPQAGLERTTLSSARLFSLVLTARESLADKPCCLGGVPLRAEEGTCWHSKAGMTDSAQVKQICLAALGAQVSNHSAITGGTTSPARATAARHAASLHLAAGALRLATSAGLLSSPNPTPEIFAATGLLVYTLRTATAGEGALGQYQRAMLAQRSQVLETVITQRGSDDGEGEGGAPVVATAVGGLHVNWALADAALAAHTGAERPFLTERELELHFGLVQEQLEGDLAALESVAKRVVADGLYVPMKMAEALGEVASRGCLWSLRALLRARTARTTRAATLAEVAPTLYFASSTLIRLGDAWATLTARVASLGAQHVARWNEATHDAGRRILGIDLFVHGVLAPFLESPLSSGNFAPAELALTRTIRWRAARAIKGFLPDPASAASGAGVLVPDSLGRPSWIGSCVGSLPPGIGVVMLALEAARDCALGGELAEVGLTLADLGVLLDGLRQTVVLGGPSSRQAEALAKGIRVLEQELGVQPSRGSDAPCSAEAEMVAAGMVERALVALRAMEV